MESGSLDFSALKEHYEIVLKCINMHSEWKNESANLRAITAIPNPLKLTDAQKMELFFLGLHNNIKLAAAYFSGKYSLPKKELIIYLSEVRKQAACVLLDKPLLYTGEDAHTDDEDSYVADFPHMDRNFVMHLRDSLEFEIPDFPQSIVYSNDDTNIKTQNSKEESPSPKQSQAPKKSKASPSKMPTNHEPELKKSKPSKEKSSKK